VKCRRQHTDYNVRITPKRDRPTQNIRPLAVTVLPRGIAEDYGARRARNIFTIAKVATNDWSNSKRAKETGAHCGAIHPLRLRPSIQGKKRAVICLQRSEDFVLLLPI
jgi:hypothetical protein